MINFKEIPTDGEDWELFTRDFLQEMGFFIESPPKRGPDLGQDLLASEQLKGTLAAYRFCWLVSCKHFAHSRKSVKEIDEPNIIERVTGFNADGFMGFYSTIPSSGLNNRLTQLKANGAIKDFRLFDRRLIEKYMLRIGFSDIMMRYFPESYKTVKPLHLLTEEYIPLECQVCGRDLLQSWYDHPYGGLVAFAARFDKETGKRIVVDLYWACKGNCDRTLSSKWEEQAGLLTLWDDIGDIVIPQLYMRHIMSFINNLRSGKIVYEDAAFEKQKHFIAALAQKVFRESTGRELARTQAYLAIRDAGI